MTLELIICIKFIDLVVHHNKCSYMNDSDVPECLQRELHWEHLSPAVTSLKRKLECLTHAITVLLSHFQIRFGRGQVCVNVPQSELVFLR